ncbi:MAG: hypothetical protein ACTFAK_00470 [Candidatus Electronema sp. VV]
MNSADVGKEPGKIAAARQKKGDAPSWRHLLLHLSRFLLKKAAARQKLSALHNLHLLRFDLRAHFLHHNRLNSSLHEVLRGALCHHFAHHLRLEQHGSIILLNHLLLHLEQSLVNGLQGRRINAEIGVALLLHLGGCGTGEHQSGCCHSQYASHCQTFHFVTPPRDEDKWTGRISSSCRLPPERKLFTPGI